jgi:ABC-type sugar transport system ATPase subunit
LATVVLDKVVKRLGGAVVVDEVSLDVREGEFMVLLGPSGCGKTTTLRMIAGLEPVTSGRIMIGDSVANDVHPSDRDVAMVFQNYALYPHMTVRRNLGYGLIRRGTDKRLVSELVDDMARRLGLEQLLDRKPSQLSGGQRQRVALGRAVIRKPKVFLMDEPLSNLDAKLRVDMRTELIRLQNELGTTTIYVTHDQVEAMTMGHRVAIMNGGHIEQVGAPLELFRRPSNRFVAEFMGHPGINLFRGVITNTGGRSAFAGEGVLVPLQADYPTGDVWLGIRPQHLKATSSGAAGPVPDNILGTAQLDFVEHLGTESFALCSLEGRTLVAAADNYYEYVRGETVNLSAEPRDLHFFDTASGARVGAPSDGAAGPSLSRINGATGQPSSRSTPGP